METTLLDGSTYSGNVIDTTKISFIHVRTGKDKNIKRYSFITVPTETWHGLQRTVLLALPTTLLL